MRRLPIYFLIDVSESMVGQPIEQVQDGMRTIIQDLRVNPYALETVFVSIIGFAGKAHRITELTELYKFYPPKFPIMDFYLDHCHDLHIQGIAQPNLRLLDVGKTDTLAAAADFLSANPL